MTKDSLKDTILARLAELHQAAPGSIGDQFQFSLLDTDEQGKQITFRCHTSSWMRNPAGTLHGGISAAICDQAMGFLAYCLKNGEGFAPTVQMQTEYHLPMFPEKPILAKVTVVSVSRTMTHLRVELYHEEQPDRLCVSATGVYYFQILRH